MSDCFDHELDAWEQYLSDEYPEDDDGSTSFQSNGSYTRKSEFVVDPNYYHEDIAFTALKRETDKAYLITRCGIDLWIPKKIVRSLDIVNNRMLVHLKTYRSIYATATSSPFKGA